MIDASAVVWLNALEMEDHWINKKYDFHWEIINVILGGKSLLDSGFGLKGFPLSSMDDADRFLASYGYDYENPIERAEVLGNFRESLVFIEKYFLTPGNPEGASIEIPKTILEIQDIRDLLLMAGYSVAAEDENSKKKLLRDWACAILKVMHVIAHIDKDLRFVYYSDVQKQILDRFYKFVHRTEEGELFLAESLDDPMRIQLMSFETKPKKSRDSVLLKLLHKPENVADEIFDRVGIRFITKSRLEAFRAVKYLKDHMIVMPANIKASRSRNTLLDVDLLKQDLEFLREKFSQNEMDEKEFEERLEASVRPQKQEPENPHTSQYYRSVQFTCRQLIKLKNPLYKRIRDLKSLTKNHTLPEEVKDLIKNLDLKYLQQEIRFFYPYEVQIVDQASHIENEKGRSAHSEYKKSQLHTAMRRVLGDLLHDLKR